MRRSRWRPRERQIKQLKDAGIAVVPSIGAKRHAEKVAAWGADAVIVQGGEGGGHTGSVATTLLLPQVVDAVDIPVIAAGGFFDGRGLVAALAYGAAGIAMGTRFLLTQESTVPESGEAVLPGAHRRRHRGDRPHRRRAAPRAAHRVRGGARAHQRAHRAPRALRNAAAFKKMSGSSWRAIVREGLAMRKEADLKWSQLALAANTPMLLRAGLVEGRLDAGVLSSGQVAGVIEDLPSVADLVARIITEAEDALKRLGDLS